MREAESRAPEHGTEHQHWQQKEDPGNFEPDLAAHALKRTQKSAHAPGHTPRCLAGSPPAHSGIHSPGLPLRADCLGTRRMRTVAPKGLPGHATYHAQPDAQYATNGLRFHFDMMVAVTLGDDFPP